MGVVYFDESGDEGFTFDKPNTSSEWFVLGAAVHHNGVAHRIREHYAAYRGKHHFNQDNWWFHFQKASHDERLAFISHMKELPYVLFSVVVHKPSLNKTDNFKRKYFLYFYAARILLERITWWADAANAGKLQLMFSTRGGLSTDAACEYLKTFRESRFTQRDHMKWEYIDYRKVFVQDNKELIGLQMADCFASSVAKAIEISRFGTIEDRYARELSPMLYRHNGSARSGGVKFFPELNLNMLHPGNRLGWVFNL